MRKFLIAAVLILLGACGISAADIPIFPSGPVYTISSSLVWGTTGSTGFNNNFFFTPLSQNESACVYIQNNNPTNPHTFFANIAIHPNPSENTPSDSTWLITAQSGASGLTVLASPSQSSVIGGYVSGAAVVAIRFSNSTTQAGNPDTAVVTLVQTQGGCFFGTNGSAVSNQLNAISQAPEFQAVSEGLGQAFAVSDNETNPAANTVMAHVWIATAGSKNEYLDHVIISSSAITEIKVNLTTTAGTACSNNAGANVKQGSGAPFATSDFHCTGAPTVSVTLADINLPAGGSFLIDLKGVIASVANSGITVINIPAVAAGTVTSTVYWYER